ncbi:hypothetical protein XCV1318 [Xanthomonas euvesicatoria pv. vesicatoria str. 85-10]|uniref:Uncharacterized protein n=1 Tax=Xanthomonas euvesicatoria pv. vesicatoria (strain 85-10) TaxID=316273 RepID=Q3BW14_XANE5|nr:hypothetical protein XCV1318 [Xanthomonas euvesicatoria pv. vesicatoria str. 85-10]
MGGHWRSWRAFGRHAGCAALHPASRTRSLLLCNAAAFMPAHPPALDVPPHRRQGDDASACPACRRRAQRYALPFLRRLILFGLQCPDGARHGSGNADRKSIAAGSKRSDAPSIGHRQGPG